MKYTLAEIADINKFSISKSDNLQEIIYLDTSSITENFISGTCTMPLPEAPSRAQRKVKSNTIVYSTVRPRLKHYGILNSPPYNLIVSSGFVTIDLKKEYEDKIDARYLFLLLTQPAITEYIACIADSAVSAYPSFNPSDISEIAFPFPNIEKQKAISEIWSNFEQKISINRQINDNLEAMAKQLYDYWFVQFDFPNEEGKPYKSSGGAMVWNEKLKREIPEGWNVANVFDELSVQYGFPFSTELFTEEPTSIPVVRIRDILENSVSAYSEEEVDEKYKLQKQDLLVGMDGNFHMNYWNDNVSYLNQRSVRLRAKSKSTVSIMQAKYDIAPYIKAKELRAKGSTVGHLADKDLKELCVLVCPNTDFRNKFDSILAEIIENRCEMIELTKQRDELLPLLMNGQAMVNYHLSVFVSPYYIIYRDLYK